MAPHCVAPQSQLLLCAQFLEDWPQEPGVADEPVVTGKSPLCLNTRSLHTAQFAVSSNTAKAAMVFNQF